MLMDGLDRSNANMKMTHSVYILRSSVCIVSLQQLCAALYWTVVQLTFGRSSSFSFSPFVLCAVHVLLCTHYTLYNFLLLGYLPLVKIILRTHASSGKTAFIPDRTARLKKKSIPKVKSCVFLCVQQNRTIRRIPKYILWTVNMSIEHTLQRNIDRISL